MFCSIPCLSCYHLVIKNSCLIFAHPHWSFINGKNNACLFSINFRHIICYWFIWAYAVPPILNGFKRMQWFHYALDCSTGDMKNVVPSQEVADSLAVGTLCDVLQGSLYYELKYKSIWSRIGFNLIHDITSSCCISVVSISCHQWSHMGINHIIMSTTAPCITAARLYVFLVCCTFFSVC